LGHSSSDADRCGYHRVFDVSIAWDGSWWNTNICSGVLTKILPSQNVVELEPTPFMPVPAS
ncbi:hypothetical protein ACQP3D_27970, partial [Escherichia coli]